MVTSLIYIAEVGTGGLLLENGTSSLLDRSCGALRPHTICPALGALENTVRGKQAQTHRHARSSEDAGALPFQNLQKRQLILSEGYPVFRRRGVERLQAAMHVAICRGSSTVPNSTGC